MNGELDQIEKNQTWDVFPRIKDKNVIGTKWVFKNKQNENAQVVINKAKLVVTPYFPQIVNITRLAKDYGKLISMNM